MSSSKAKIEDLSPPGEFIEELLEEKGMSQAELSRRTGLSEKHISQLVNARSGLTADAAVRLEQVFQIPARFWNSLESNYRLQMTRAARNESLKDFGTWMRSFPIAAMRKADYFLPEVPGGGVVDRVEALLSFFGVSNPDAWSAQWEFAQARFHKSPSFNPSIPALTAWLRRSEVEAEEISCSEYSESAFRNALDAALALTTVPASEMIPKLVTSCADAGVAVTFVPSLPKLAISGAALWISKTKAHISLSLRHKSDDQLWFSFFHEACHILKHRRNEIRIDSAADSNHDPEEVEANEFARDHLIKPSDYSSFVSTWRGTESEISRFAKSIKIAPGIVVGRLQHDGKLARDRGNKLKIRYAWDFEQA